MTERGHYWKIANSVLAAKSNHRLRHVTILENRVNEVVPFIVSAPHRPVDQGEYQPNLQKNLEKEIMIGKLSLKVIWRQTMGTGIEAQAVRGLHCLRATSLCVGVFLCVTKK